MKYTKKMEKEDKERAHEKHFDAIGRMREYLLNRGGENYTILENWNELALKGLIKKFRRRGLKVFSSIEEKWAVIEGKQWASLEEINGDVLSGSVKMED